mgnify:FL=1|tara:strand:- start:5374 stop:5997 length:624 start_codon:yes stop_codon:yes gene_type:complete
MFEILINQNLLLLLVVFGLALAIIPDYYQLIFKKIGFQAGKLATGYNNAMKVMVLNRFGAVLYFLCISFMVDTKTSLSFLFQAYMLSFFVITIFAIYIFKKHSNNYKVNSLIYAAFISDLFNKLGLSIPFILGILLPEYRLTLAQTGFLFNTIYLIINVFIIENDVSKNFDTKGADFKPSFNSIIIGRALSCMVVTLVFTCLFYFFE